MRPKKEFLFVFLSVMMGVAYFSLADLPRCSALKRSIASPFVDLFSQVWGRFLEEETYFQTACISLNKHRIRIRAGNNRCARRIDSIGRIEFTLSSIRLYCFSRKSVDTTYNNLEKNNIPANKAQK